LKKGFGRYFRKIYENHSEIYGKTSKPSPLRGREFLFISTCSPSPLEGEGLPCGVTFNTPQGKGEGVYSKFVTSFPIEREGRLGGEKKLFPSHQIAYREIPFQKHGKKK
jgi:hypothetical protein